VSRTPSGSRFARFALVGAVALVTILAACSGSEEGLPKPKPGFCEAASRYDKRVERGASIDEQITILEKLQRNAPKDVAADASLFLDSMREFQSGNTKERDAIKADPKIQHAVDQVERRAANGCGFYEQEPGSGGM
jgi:hypothetical protein